MKCAVCGKDTELLWHGVALCSRCRQLAAVGPSEEWLTALGAGDVTCFRAAVFMPKDQNLGPWILDMDLVKAE